MLTIEWEAGGRFANADDERRVLAAARAVLDAAGVVDDVAAEAAYLADNEAGVESTGAAAAWRDALAAANRAATDGWHCVDGGAITLTAWESAGAAALRAAGFAIGDRIQAGRGEDRDTGRIVAAIDAGLCRVAWDSGVVTPCAITDMTRAE